MGCEYRCFDIIHSLLEHLFEEYTFCHTLQVELAVLLVRIPAYRNNEIIRLRGIGQRAVSILYKPQLAAVS